MATEPERDTSRAVVKTYVPAYQREEWDEHAEELDMSRSEFVRSMVQAGRRGFEEWADGSDYQDSDHEKQEPETQDETSGQASGQELEELVVETLSETDYLSWEQLLAAVTDDIETRLEETLQRLQDENRVRYSGRNGGYTLER